VSVSAPRQKKNLSAGTKKTDAGGGGSWYGDGVADRVAALMAAACDAILFHENPSMKTCPNEKCPLFGRIVYALATRCAVCKWDLKATLPASEEAHSKPNQVSRAQSAAR